MVGNIGVLPVGTKVPNEQTHGVAATLYALVGPVPPVLGGHQVAVSPCSVAVADHDVGAQLLASGELHTGGSTVFNQDALDLGVAAQGHAPCLQQIDHALHDGAGAAHGRVNPVAPLQGVDQAVNTGHRERIAANQQGLQAHGHAQFGMLEVARHQAVHGAPSPHTSHGGQGCKQIKNTVKGLAAQGFEPELVAKIRLSHEFIEARHIVRADPGYLGAHALGVTAVIEMGSVIKPNPVKGVHQAQIDIVRELASTQLPEFFKQKRHGDDGWSAVESKAVLAPDIGPPARAVELFQHLHPVAHGTQANCRCQAAKARTNHQGQRHMAGPGPAARTRGQ